MRGGTTHGAVARDVCRRLVSRHSRSSTGVVLRVALLALPLSELLAAPLGAQLASDTLALSGRVVRQTPGGPRAVARELVVLHRVNARQAGPVDSVRTDADGGYAFRVTAPDSASMYLASARFAGIAYFAPPAQAGQPATPTDIVVFDTTSRDVPLRLQGRHLVLSAPNAEGVRNVIDVFEIENDTIYTRVAGVSNRPTFSVRLPDGAQNARVTQGDVSDAAVITRNGRADVFAPLSPGLRQLVLTYELPPGVFPLALPLERATGLMEVLLEESAGTATGAGLVSQGDVSVDGKHFVRYLGNNASSEAVVTLRVTGAAAAPSASLSVPPWVVPSVLSLLTLGGLLALARRSATADGPLAAQRSSPLPRVRDTRTSPPTHSTVSDLARHLAAVDTLLDSGDTMSTAQRSGLSHYRAAVKRQLVGALAHRD